MKSAKTRKLWAKIHTYAGLAFALILTLQALTGIALVFNAHLLRLERPELVQGFQESYSVARLLDAAEQIDGFETETVLGPGGQLELGSYIFIGESDRAELADRGEIGLFLNQETGEEVAQAALRDVKSFIPLIIHQSLLAGDIGKTILAATGLFLAVSSLTGLYLWWPATRKALVHKAARPRLRGRLHMKAFQLHSWLGFWLLAPTILLGLTGAMIQRPDWFGIDGPDVEELALAAAPAASNETACPAPRLSGLYGKAMQDYSGSEVIRMDRPKDDMPFWRIMLKRASDADTITGDIQAFYSPRCLKRVFEYDKQASESWIAPRLLEWHSFRFLGRGKYLAGLVMGLAMIFFPVAGVYIWFKRRRKAARPA